MLFPSLIFGLLHSQRPLQEPNEYLSSTLQHYQDRFKGKDAIEGEQGDLAVATGQLAVATEPSAGSSSILVQAFFKSELRFFKEKQMQHDQRFDKTVAHLQQMEELLWSS